MAETPSEEYRNRTEAGSSEDHSQTVDSSSNVEWRSYEQVENGTPSTSPFWDTDSEDDGLKPSELFGKHTWKIENFSKVNKRELRSDPFDAGGYKWYILIYPQGCDVCNHISLFLCVANHDKLLPGWSHFAQFTIAVVNKDPKKSKYSDTLHRFWKKEHDWGWKKFMELSKVQDGFLVEGVLVIKAQVQVIREKLDRPFRCLDRLYRRELVRIYMTNIETICRRFVEEKRTRFIKLIDDKSKCASFHGFWLGISASARHCLSRERSDAILKTIVKHFFIEKEVTSTLIMDALYSGLRALELQSVRNKKKRRGVRLADLNDMPPPMVWFEEETFVLADDLMSLLERAVLEPVPYPIASPGKDDKVSQNRTTKDGTPPLEEITKDTIERDERRLTEFGQKILELFILSHIFSGVEVRYQEAIALKRQEELIREEEAWINETETKGRRDKERKTKKKQAKQKKNKKSKEKERDDKLDLTLTYQEEIHEDNGVASESVSETGEPDINGEDALIEEVMANNLEVVDRAEHIKMLNDEETGKGNFSSADDEWVPVVSSNKGSSMSSNNRIQTSPNRGNNKNQRSKSANERMGLASAASYPNERASVTNERVSSPPVAINKSSEPFLQTNGKGENPQLESSAAAISLKNRIQKLEQRLLEKEQSMHLQKKLEPKDQSQSQSQSQAQAQAQSQDQTQAQARPQNPTKPATSISATLSQSNPSDKPQPSAKPYIPLIKSSTHGAANSSMPALSGAALSSATIPSSNSSFSLPVASTHAAAMANKHTVVTTRPPLSPKPESVLRIAPEPAIPAQNKNSALPSSAQVPPYLFRSLSSSGRSGAPPDMDSPPTAPGNLPQSYRNAIITGSNSSLNLDRPVVGFTSQSGQSFAFGATTTTTTSTNSSTSQSSSSSSFFSSSPSFKSPILNHSNGDSIEQASSSSNGGFIPGWSSNDLRDPPNWRAKIADEFPHMDIINDLLEEPIRLPKFTLPSWCVPVPGIRQQPGTSLAGGSALFDTSERYNPSFARPSYGSDVREGQHSFQFSSAPPYDNAPYYVNGQNDAFVQKHWGYEFTGDLGMNMGMIDLNGLSHGSGEFSYVPNGVSRFKYNHDNSH